MRETARRAPVIGPSTELRAYVATLRARKWSVIGVALLTLGAALAFSFRQTPIYETQTQVLLKPPALEPGQPGAGTPPDMATEERVAESDAVAGFVTRSLGGQVPADALQRGLSVESSAESEILTFRYSDEDARRAQALSAAFAKAYLEFRQQDLRSDLLATYQAQKDRITALENRMEQLNREYEGTQDPQKRATLQAEANELHGQIGYLRNLLAQSTPPKDIRVGRIVDSPDYPTSPASPNYLLNGGLGLFVGLALGIGLAFLRERLDDRLRGREDLEAILGASVLTVVPRVRSWKRSDRPLLITTTDPQSLPAEAYRSLRTSLLFATSSHGLKTLLITSAQEDEGKTSTTANLGVVLAQGGKNVILVSADLRKPRLHRFFGVEDGSGLTDILTGEIAPAEALIAVQPNDLRLIRSGPVPGNPADLLGSEAMARVMSELRDSADLVLIDAAPLLAVADPVTLAPLVDGVLFVADAARATQSGVEQARERLDQVNARIAGAVLNNYDPARSSSRYYYGHYYSQRPRTTSEEVSLPASEVRSG